MEGEDCTVARVTAHGPPYFSGAHTLFTCCSDDDDTATLLLKCAGPASRTPVRVEKCAECVVSTNRCTNGHELEFV